MTGLRSFALLSLLSVPARCYRSHVGGARSGLPCELKLSHVKVGDEMGVKATAICTDSVDDVTLVVPRWNSGLFFDFKFPEGLEKGMTVLGKARKMAGPYINETMVGTTYTLKGSYNGVPGSVTATVTEEAEVVEPETTSDAPCTLEKQIVNLQGGAEGFKLIVECSEKVEVPRLEYPAPYPTKSFNELKAGARTKIAGPFKVEQFKGKDFVFHGDNFQVKVTI